MITCTRRWLGEAAAFSALFLSGCTLMGDSVGLDRIDGVMASVAIKAPVAAATTGAIVLSGAQTVDGVVLANTSPPTRVLVKDQADQKQNGIYDVADTAWRRSPDFDGNRDAVHGTVLYIANGSSNGAKFAKLTTDDPIIIGTTALAFALLGAGPLTPAAIADVTKFGAVGDGATDDTAAIQSAINSGSGTIYFPNPPVAYMATHLTVPSGVRLVGQNKYLTIARKLSDTGKNFVDIVNSASNVSIEEMTLDNNSIGAWHILGLSFVGAVAGPGGNNTLLRRIQFLNGGTAGSAGRPALRSAWTTAIKDFVIDECDFKSCVAGGIATEPTVPGHKNIVVKNCLFDGVGTSNFQLSTPSQSPFTPDTYIGVQILDNIMINPVVDLVNYPNGPIQFEHWGCTDYVARGNYIDGGTRGLTTGASMKNGLVEGNIVANQTNYATEFAAGTNVNVAFKNNICVNCAEGVAFTGAGSNTGINIEENIFVGTGLAAIGGNPRAINALAGANFFPLTIKGNIFKDLEYQDYVIANGGSAPGVGSTVIIEDNEFIGTTLKSCASGIAFAADYLLVRNNKWLRSVNIDASYPYASTYHTFVDLQVNAGAGPIQIVEDNRIAMTGALLNGHGFYGASTNAGAAAMTGLNVLNNRLEGAFTVGIGIQDSGGSAIVLGNDMTLVTAGTLYSLNAAILKKNTLRGPFSGAAAPAAGAWLVGDSVVNDTPVVGQPTGWKCTVAGSPGTWVALANL